MKTKYILTLTCEEGHQPAPKGEAQKFYLFHVVGDHTNGNILITTKPEVAVKFDSMSEALLAGMDMEGRTAFLGIRNLTVTDAQVELISVLHDIHP